MTKEQIKKTILIVEDDLSILRLLVDKLTLEGFEILQAHDGREGLRMAMSKHPDLILLDIMMPIMDGLTMMKQLRAKDTWGKNVPIILLSNLSPDVDRIKKSIIEDGPVYYLLKPNWNMDDVVAKVRESLNESELVTRDQSLPQTK